MEEKKVLKKQFIKHITYNMIMFTIILLCFGIMLFLKIRNITFSNIDKQLLSAKNEFLNTNIFITQNPDLFYFDNSYPEIDDNKFQLFNPDFGIRVKNPQITTIFRDSNYEISNLSELGKLSYYASDIPFDPLLIDIIYDLKINNTYNYRILTFENTDETSSIKYIQLLINSDSEYHILSKYFQIILFAVILGIILSIIASLILSNITLKPIELILTKQTEFIQNASHELRTPLTIIQAKQELLLQEPEAKIMDKSEEIALTLEETKRLSKLTKNLMTLVKDSNLQPTQLQKEDILLDDFIRKISTPYSEIAEVEDKKLNLELNFNKDISVDTSKIHQLFIILLDNALKYTESGDTITIKTYLKDNKCIIEICDTGIGIQDENLDKIFERFYREDKARSRETGGNGLGLSIASAIVKLHNGTIKASHNLPKGSIFTIKLNR